MKNLSYLLLLFIGLGEGLSAQEGDSKAATGGARPPQMNQGFLGRDVPVMDPGSDTSTFDGKLWNMNNNRLFRSRFEKYLNAPAETSEADQQYESTINQILTLLSPGKVTSANVDAAWNLLPKASEYRSDANLCNSLADVIYSVWLAKNESARLEMANRTLQREKSALEWNYRMNLGPSTITATTPSGTNPTTSTTTPSAQDEARMEPIKEALSDVRATMVNNKLKKEASIVQAKIDFQSMIIQYFAQRRFCHVLIGTRFYRSLFGDGDSRLNAMDQIASSLPVDKDAGQVRIKAKLDPKISAKGGSGAYAGAGTGTNGRYVGGGADTSSSGGGFSAEGGQFGVENLGVESLISAGASGLKALGKMINSLGQIDALANEAIRDVDEGIESYKFLLEKNELKSATERLFETFMMGEYMPSVRKLSRDDKRRALEFTRKTNELLGALEVNDLTRAEDLIKELSQTAKDFDTSKPLAVVETAKTVSAMHLAKAKAAASSGDRTTLETELRAATEIWPRNPALAQVSGAIFSQTDVQQQALNDFDRLSAQKNYRQIFDDKVRYIAATAMYPERQEKLKTVLDRVQGAEAALMRATELAKRGDPAGAWESVERGFSDYPDDPKLNQARADFTTQAAEFVRSVRTAQEMERKQQTGSSLAWYLRALQDYPNSEIARDGIDRISAAIVK
jgi:tetratricopeptide (TPR) repeat protein